MGHKAPEPLLSYEEVQRVIDERLEAILEQEASDPELNQPGHRKTDVMRCKLKEFWKRMTKRDRK